MDNKFVLESFDEFLKYVNHNISEKDDSDPGREMSSEVAMDLLEKIAQYNLDLLDNDIKSRKEGNVKDQLSIALPLLREGEGGKAILKHFIERTSYMSTKERDAIEKVFGVKLTEEERLRKSRRKDKMDKLAKDVDSMSKSDADKKAELYLKQPLDSNERHLSIYLETQALWLILPESDKKKLAEDFSKLAMKRGYSSEAPLSRVIDKIYKEEKRDGRYFINSPGYDIGTESESIKSKESSSPMKQTKTFMISEDKESDVFKPNATGANGESDFQGEGYQEMLNNLGSIFERYLAGEITTLKKINILTSADRYRNTGESASLSWGQLSYSRAQTMARVIESIATKVGIDDDIISQLPKIINIYYKGENGDGTSGPNPPEGIKFGYYIKDGNGVKFVDGKDRNEVTLVDIDEEGTPKSVGPKIKNIEPESDKESYNQYRYSNIEIEFERVDEPADAPNDSEEYITNLKFPSKISIPQRFSTKKIRIPIPVITTSYSTKGKSTGAGKCEDFKETTTTSFGLSFKQVEIAKWQSDLAK